MPSWSVSFWGVDQKERKERESFHRLRWPVVGMVVESKVFGVRNRGATEVNRGLGLGGTSTI